MKLKIATPEKLILEEEVDQVTLPTKLGEITILPNHVPMIAELEFGELLAYKGEEDIPFAIWGGFVEIKNNQIVVLCDVAEFADEIIYEKVEEAKSKAEELMKRKGEFTPVEYADLLYSYERELARLTVARKYKLKKYRRLFDIRKSIEYIKELIS
jgi:F-type H+-transporting ATPase subunit epsilon